ncbi:hypothetical protein MNAN1_003700 [Malassezia nana]|uniref:Peroxin/Ferlin domain-containing protein n=1 Tax=Malassezia nana TaxID=180528 RepID=A0AAF0J461_9BASI|nr:hypothetical protein MNAN1_003700 [Malassezia nana]
MSEKANADRATAVSRTVSVKSLSFMEVIDGLPPSVIQLLVVLAPTVDLVHRTLLLLTWRGGYVMRVQSWILLVGYILTCMYGYEVLRYAPQALILLVLGYTWLCRSFARITGQRRASDELSSVKTLRKTVSQLAEIADFVSAVHECLLRPVHDVLCWKVPGYGPMQLVIFLLVTWPLWLLCVLPRHLWVTPIYYASTTLSAIGASQPVVALSNYYHTQVAPAVYRHMATNAPRLLALYEKLSMWAHGHVAPVVHSWHLSSMRLWLQTFPPFPIASLTLRHVLLVVGVILLTWCSPWATLMRAALWQSAFVRHTVMGVVRILSGSESLALRLHPKPSAKNKSRAVAEHETEFVFEIFENQRWWIGLDWTAALLPQERPSWSDSENHAVAPPASFSLPQSVRTYMPSSKNPGKQDLRTAEWRWIDAEWHVAGVQSITSSTYTPKKSMNAAEAERLSQEHSAAPTEPVEVPEQVKDVARLATEPGISMDVDAEGWQYGDNAWEKLSKESGMGRYTRRRRWLRKAVLVQSVEYGVQHSS